MAVEEPVKNHSLGFGTGPLFVFGLVASVVAIAFGINLRSKQNTFAVRKPESAVGFRGDASDLLWIAAHVPAGCIEITNPNLRTAVTTADKKKLLAVRRPPATTFSGSIGGNLVSLSTRKRDDPEMRCLFIGFQVHVHDREHHPAAVRRNDWVAYAL